MLEYLGQIAKKIASRPSSNGAGLVSLTFSSKFAAEDVFLHCFVNWSEVGIPTWVGERSRNSDRAKSEFQPRWKEFRPRFAWEITKACVTGHGAAAVVDVVAALAVGKDPRWTKQAGLGVAGASGLVPSVFLTWKAILIDSGLVSGMRQTQEVVGENELSELGKHIVPCRHVAGVACLQLVVQALHHPGLRR